MIEDMLIMRPAPSANMSVPRFHECADRLAQLVALAPRHSDHVVGYSSRDRKANTAARIAPGPRPPGYIRPDDSNPTAAELSDLMIVDHAAINAAVTFGDPPAR